MTSDDPEADDDGFADWAAECDEAVASGAAPTGTDFPATDARRRRFRRCLHRLDRARRQGQMGAAGPSGPEAEPRCTLGRFAVVRELGRGSHGVVYLAD